MDGTYYYFVYLSLPIAGLIPFFINISGHKWLPEAFVPATEILGKVLMPIAYALSVFLFFTSSIATAAPLLRFTCALFFLTYAIFSWITYRRQKDVLAIRIAAQGLVLGFVFDLLGVSLINFSSTTNEAAAITCAIVWLLSFTAQIVLSLFAPKDEPDQNSLEHTTSIVSFICIFLTPMLCDGFPPTGLAIVWLTICLVVAALGVIHAIHYKNVTWSIATAASIMIVPLIIGTYIVTPRWDGNEYLIAYSLVAIGFLIGAYYLRKIQQKETDMIGAISIIAACLAILSASAAMNSAYVGFFLISCILVAYGAISKMNFFYETAVYTLGLSLVSVVNSTISTSGVGYGTSTYYHNQALRTVLHAHIIGGTIIGAHCLSRYLYPTKNEIRLVIGYTLFTLIMSMELLFESLGNDTLMWALIFLIEQVGALLYSVFKKMNWLIWFSSIEIFLIAFKLTGGMSYLWLGVIGVGLIAIVIWQLKKANDKAQLQSQGSSNKKTDDQPKEK